MKIIFVTLSLLLAFTQSVVYAEPATSNKIQNEDFEDPNLLKPETLKSHGNLKKEATMRQQNLENHFSGSYKVLCPANSEGCACIDKDGEIKARYYHAIPVSGVRPNDESKSTRDFIEVRASGEQTCFLPRKDLQPIYWPSDRCPSESETNTFVFPPLSEILPKGSHLEKKRAVSKIFPTFYTIAIEALHDGPKVEKLIESGSSALIATVSKSFRDDLDLEGTGQLSDGRVINVGKYSPKTGWDYLVLPSDSFGYGVAGHYLYPFRSAAVDFEWLCQTAKLGDCSGGRQAVTARYAGQLLYFPKLNGLALPNGQTHDGYICAKDIGGAIVSDRIDLFVGPTGGGNPYLKECLYRNAYIDGGISSLIPWDWREFREVEPNPDGTRKFKRVNPTEYRTISPDKGLEFSVVPQVKCLKSW